MKKQITFASLTEAEIDQVASWLRHETYETVLERVRKPRPEGFGLQISRSPLERLHEKSNTLAKINARITEGQKLTRAEFDAINAAETPAPTEEIHDAIIETTRDLVFSGDHTPTQLLALQRLADFPERANYRAHKVEMDLHRKHIATRRLELAERADQRAEKAANTKPASTPDKEEDELGPVAHDWEGVRARARKAFNISEEESARRAALRKTWQEPPVDPIPNLNPTLTPNPTLVPSNEAAPAKPLNIVDFLIDLARDPEMSPNYQYPILNHPCAGGELSTAPQTSFLPIPVHSVAHGLPPSPNDHHHSRPPFSSENVSSGAQTRGGVGNATEPPLWGNTRVAGLGSQSSIFNHQSLDSSPMPQPFESPCTGGELSPAAQTLISPSPSPSNLNVIDLLKDLTTTTSLRGMSAAAEQNNQSSIFNHQSL